MNFSKKNVSRLCDTITETLYFSITLWLHIIPRMWHYHVWIIVSCGSDLALTNLWECLHSCGSLQFWGCLNFLGFLQFWSSFLVSSSFLWLSWLEHNQNAEYRWIKIRSRMTEWHNDMMTWWRFSNQVMLLLGLLFQEQVKEDTTVLSFGLETSSISNYIWLIRKVLQIVLSLLLSFVNNAIFGILKGRVSPQESFFFTKGAPLIPKPIVQILTNFFHPKI